MPIPTFINPDLPEAFLARMSVLLGDEYTAFLESYNQSPTISLRVNTLKLTPLSFKQLSPFSLSTIPWCSSGFIVDAIENTRLYSSPGKHPYHSAGLYYMQEPSAMAAIEVLAPQPGERVLDLAAAPGGKTTHIAASMKNEGLLVANEINSKRVWDLAENLERCGVRNTIITNETPFRLANHFGSFFDRVLLDAPCSGEGMLRKSEVARNEWKYELVKSCAQRQSAILEEASRLVRPGGWLEYTTCTFSVEENEGVIVKFLEDHPEFILSSIPHSPGYKSGRPEWVGLPKEHGINLAVRLWPHHLQGEGHFIALLHKNENRENAYKMSGLISAYEVRKLKKAFQKASLSPQQLRLVEKFIKENLTITLPAQKLVSYGSYIYHLPDAYSNLSGLNVIHPGWWLGSIKKDRFEPSHAFALGIKSNQAQRSVGLKMEGHEVISYLTGESFSSSGEDGWVLMTVDDYPIGWGKRVKNIIKNYYPHGLRW